MAQAKLERLMNLIAYLTQTRRPLTLKEIVETVPGYPESFSSAQRTFERDKEELREMNFDIALEETPNGESGYRILKENTYFDVKLNSAQRSIVEYALGLYGPEKKISEKAITKLGGMNPENEIGEIKSLPMPDLIEDLYAAVSNKSMLKIDFRSNERRVQPKRIIARSGFWYLEAIDLDKNQFRIFRIDRIKKIEVDKNYSPETSRIEVDIFDEERDLPVEIAVKVNSNLVDQFCATWNAKFNSSDQTVTFSVSRPELFLSHLFEYSGFVAIVEPPDLKKRVEQMFEDAQLCLKAEI